MTDFAPGDWVVHRESGVIMAFWGNSSFRPGRVICEASHERGFYYADEIRAATPEEIEEAEGR